MQRRWRHLLLFSRHYKKKIFYRNFSTVPNENKSHGIINLLRHDYPTDDWTNITPKIISKLGQNLYLKDNHPLSFVRQRIINYFYKTYYNRIGNPLFSVYDNLNPIVTTVQNFDSLLVPSNHPSRNKTDCYFINQDTLLRAHTTAHQAELIAMGLNNFLVIGDVYRRDEIDSSHYPVFHQLDGVRLCTPSDIFEKTANDSNQLHIFDHGDIESDMKQGCHTLEAVKVMEHDLKKALVGLAETLFGPNIKYRWINQYFPFTHPSWELEVFYNNKWLEVLGCGIIRHEILERAGCLDRIGWAFGLGLDRLAMRLYSIPDIRLFWSNDSGFLKQFVTNDVNAPITYKPVSVHPQLFNDISFWLPLDNTYSSNDFYDIARDIGGDVIEQIYLIDNFVHPKTKQVSHCYKIVYRHLERALTQKEVTIIHTKIREIAAKQLKVILR